MPWTGSGTTTEPGEDLDRPPPPACVGEVEPPPLFPALVGVRGVADGAADDAVLPVATGFTSTVLPAAALLRLVRRRGVGEGVAIRGKSWKRNGNGGGERLPIRPDSSGR